MVTKQIQTHIDNQKDKPSELSKFTLSFEYDKTYREVIHEIKLRSDKTA